MKKGKTKGTAADLGHLVDHAVDQLNQLSTDTLAHCIHQKETAEEKGTKSAREGKGKGEERRERRIPGEPRSFISEMAESICAAFCCSNSRRYSLGKMGVTEKR